MFQTTKLDARILTFFVRLYPCTELEIPWRPVFRVLRPTWFATYDIWASQEYVLTFTLLNSSTLTNESFLHEILQDHGMIFVSVQIYPLTEERKIGRNNRLYAQR